MAWNYSKKVKDHYLRPRNVGVVENANAVGEIGSMVCGDALKLTLKVDENETILDAKFQTYGCGSAIASSSALTEIIKGMTLDQALNVSNRDLADYLDGLPEEKMHCSVMGKEALEAAVANYRGEKLVHEEEEEGKIVCHCFAITDKQIEKTFLSNDLTTVGEVTNYTKAGGACGACLSKIDAIVTAANAKRDALKAPPQKEHEPVTRPAGKLSMYKKIRLIEEIMEKEIRPALGYDHGGLELVDMDETTLYVKLTGRCTSCANNESTLAFIKGQIEAVLGEPINLENIAEQ